MHGDAKPCIAGLPSRALAKLGLAVMHNPETNSNFVLHAFSHSHVRHACPGPPTNKLQCGWGVMVGEGGEGEVWIHGPIDP